MKSAVCVGTDLTPFRIPRGSVVGVSGGRSSAMMLWHILRAWGGDLPPDILLSFQNTGLEDERTLVYLDNMRRHWGANIVWLEYVPPPLGESYKTSGGYKIVTFETAARNGEPFRGLVNAAYHARLAGGAIACPSCNGAGSIGQLFPDQKCLECGGTGQTAPNGLLPNPAQRWCTTTLKIWVEEQYIKSLGMDPGGMIRVPGLRYDEPRRVSKARARGSICPLSDAKIVKADVLAWAARQPFDLGMPDMLGNCGGCFMKARNKLLWIAKMAPEKMAPFMELEETTGTRFRNNRQSYRQMMQTSEAMSLAAIERLVDDDDGQESLFPCACTD